MKNTVQQVCLIEYEKIFCPIVKWKGSVTLFSCTMSFWLMGMLGLKHSTYIYCDSNFYYVVVHLLPFGLVWGKNQVYCVCMLLCPNRPKLKLSWNKKDLNDSCPIFGGFFFFFAGSWDTETKNGGRCDVINVLLIFGTTLILPYLAKLDNRR